MGDRERDPGKRKVPWHEASGESSEGASRRTRARTTEGPVGEDGAGGENPSLPLGTRDDRSRMWRPRPQPQQQPAAQRGGEEGDRAGLRTLDLVSQLDRRVGSLQHQESSGMRNQGTLVRPPQVWMPSSSSQMNSAWDSTRQRPYVTDAHLAAAMVSQSRPQAPSSSQAQRSRRQQPGIGPISFPPTHTSGSLPQGPSMRVPSSGAQRGNTSGDGDSARGRGLQMQAPAPVTPGQPQLRPNAGSLVNCPACHNNPQVFQCPLCGRELVNFSIDHRRRRPPLPAQQGQTHLPAALTNHGVLVGQQLSGHAFGPWKPRASVLEGQAQPSGKHHFLQVPEHQRCPVCRNLPGLFVLNPQPHFCLCASCRASHVLCPWCAGFAPPGRQRQPPRKGES